MTYCITECTDDSYDSMCKEIAGYLSDAYPGHTWYVRIDGGMLIIKDYKISDTWSMARKLSDIQHDAKRRKHDVIMAAGEFLECANMRRGAWDGEYAKELDGRMSDNKFEPVPQTNQAILTGPN